MMRRYEAMVRVTFEWIIQSTFPAFLSWVIHNWNLDSETYIWSFSLPHTHIESIILGFSQFLITQWSFAVTRVLYHMVGDISNKLFTTIHRSWQTPLKTAFPTIGSLITIQTAGLSAGNTTWGNAQILVQYPFNDESLYHEILKLYKVTMVHWNLVQKNTFIQDVNPPPPHTHTHKHTHTYTHILTVKLWERYGYGMNTVNGCICLWILVEFILLYMIHFASAWWKGISLASL